MPTLITTFPNRDWIAYAKDCLASMVKYWPGSIHVYVDGQAPSSVDGVEFRPFMDPDRDAFLARDIPVKGNYLYAAKRFCHKVFAQLDFAKEGKPFWWFDADVMFYGRPPEHLFEQNDFVTFFGRKGSYTETGVIGFNPEHEGFHDFADRYRAMYVDGKLLDLRFWTDCHAFDAAREEGGTNLSPEGRGVENVVAASEYGKYFFHLKGPRKMDVYRGGADEIRASL